MLTLFSQTLCWIVEFRRALLQTCTFVRCVNLSWLFTNAKNESRLLSRDYCRWSAV